MASFSEVGHAKNIANFSSLIQILEEMQATYNPTNPNLKLSVLTGHAEALEQSIATLNETIPEYKNAVANRENAIKPLGKRATSISNSFKSLNVSDSDKENVASLVKKIRGDVKHKSINPAFADADSISNSQMSYDSRIANLGVLVGQLKSHDLYNPNENEIKVPALNTYRASLAQLSKTVNAASNALITARKNRNDLLYTTDNNVLDLARDIKAYIRSLGESASLYYKAAVRLKFTRK